LGGIKKANEATAKVNRKEGIKKKKRDGAIAEALGAFVREMLLGE
jgi:hypothetical protein